MRDRSLTVSQLCAYVKGVFEDELVLHNLCVVGEVSECKQTPSATFLTLKDEESCLRCVCFERLDPPTEGEKVSLFGSVRFHERGGNVSFVFNSFTRVGEGALLARLKALRDKLRAEGVFDTKKQIASPIRHIGVITGETGVVIHDFVKTLWQFRNFGAVHVYPVTVQGKTAATEIVAALAKADAAGYDLLCVLRGGGSEDDLSVFNDESLVRAVANCRTPVLSAVGHETDVTLCDFAASIRAGTPSMAGEWIAQQNESLFQKLYACADRLVQGMERLKAKRATLLYRTAAALAYKSEQKLDYVRYKLADAAHDLSDGALRAFGQKQLAVKAVGAKLESCVEQKVAAAQMRIGEISANLQKNSPLRILSMGYAKLFDANGKPVGACDVKKGDEIRAVCADGSITATVTKTEKGENHDA